ncbi:MAG: high-affinity iron transporter [Candidatus Tokpelaia sp. JSC189]|nr:MAG: high-affinity iron transporter [Candidatus Tokpelaia sp. JSC189]
MQLPLFIVWRESVEALLIIGILYAWLRRENLASQTSQLWIGTGLGLLLAGILAAAFYVIGQWFSGPGGEWFFTFMMIFASILILQMLTWMHRHGSGIKKQFETKATESLKRRRQFSIMMLAAIAVAREGSETVVFLAGVGMQQKGTSLSLFIFGSAAGFGLAILTFILLQKFSSAISWKWYFRISKCVLLLIGGAMMVNAFDKAASQLSAHDLPEWLYSFMDTPVWSTQWLLADNNALTSLTGYHANPSMMEISALLLYWVIAIILSSEGTQKNINGNTW